MENRDTVTPKKSGKETAMQTATSVWTSDHAATSVEYCVLLGLICVMVIVGAFALGSPVRWAARKVTGVALAEAGAISGYAGGENPAAAVRAVQAVAPSHPDEPTRRLSFWAAAVVIAGLTFVCAYLWLCRCRKQPKDNGVREPSSSEAEPLELQARIYDKRQSLLRALSSDGDLLTKNEVAARHLMTQQLLVVSPATSVAELKTLLAANHVHHLLVCEKGDRLLGVVSDRDLHMRRGKTAQAVMTPHPYTITPDTLLGPAITCLLNRHISCLPVVEDGQLRGVITTIDLALVTQCVLQLWMRLARQSRSTPGWTEELAKVAEMVSRDLNEQHSRFAGLTESLGRLERCAEDKPCSLVVVQIEEILSATKRLTGLIAKSHSALQEQGRENTIPVDSRTDAQTGLISRRGLEEILGTMLAVKAPCGQPLSLLLMAIEGCPDADDPQTDVRDPRTLRAMAEWVVKLARSTDLVARYRPDVFAIVLPHTVSEGAGAASQRIRHSAPWYLDGSQRRFKVHLASVSAVDGERLSDLLARADAALAEAVYAEDDAPCLERCRRAWFHGPCGRPNVASPRHRLRGETGRRPFSRCSRCRAVSAGTWDAGRSARSRRDRDRGED